MCKKHQTYEKFKSVPLKLARSFTVLLEVDCHVPLRQLCAGSQLQSQELGARSLNHYWSSLFCIADPEFHFYRSFWIHVLMMTG